MVSREKLILSLIFIIGCSGDYPGNDQILVDIQEQVMEELKIDAEYEIEIYGGLSVPIDKEDSSNLEYLVKLDLLNGEEIEIILEYSKIEKSWQLIDWFQKE